MGYIRVLDQGLINQIAAGEVIERPGSVIKELVENSIDAGAQKIDVIVRDGGRTYISVKDDGCGMSQEDLALCVERHATSKLTGHNLLDIHSFGFRGEALPSICSIGRVCIKTRQNQDACGWCLTLEGGESRVIEPSAHDTGTLVSIRDLFYTTPARLKFLKTNATELSYCLQNIKQLALSNPNIAFSFMNGEKQMLDYPSVLVSEEPERLISERIAQVLGSNFSENSHLIQKESNGMQCICWMCLPTYHTSVNQYCFVNKRPVKDRFLFSAIRTAYQDVLVPGEQPSFVLFLTLDPQEVDMNVHPTKAEVRFRNINQVRSFVISTVRENLAQFSNQTSTELANQFSNYAQVEPIWRNQYTDTKQNYMQIQSVVNSNRSIPLATNIPSSLAQPKETVDAETFYIRKADMPLTQSFAIEPMDQEFLGKACAQIFNSFILAQNEDTLFIIDQHAAHERIMYENIEKGLQFDGNGWIVTMWLKQKLLMPEQIELSDEDSLAIQEFIPYLNQMGFAVAYDGKKTLEVDAVPSICAETDPIGLLKDIIHELIHDSNNNSLLKKIHHIFATYTCHHSIRANHSLSIDEMNMLLRQIEQTERSGQCNHGRPSYIRISRNHLEKLFERTN